MKLNRKILLITISILFISLLVGSIVNIINFRKNYTEALITGSYGLGQSLNSIVTELLNLGLPLDSFSGMDKKCRQLVEQNPYISYVGIHDLTGKALYHSAPALVGKVSTEEVMKESIAAAKPLTQIYHRFDGHDYYDVTIPIVTDGNTHVGLIRLGFQSDVINKKVVSAIIQVVINVVVSFVLISILINYFISRFVSEPVIKLSEHARKITDGRYDIKAEVISNDEVGQLSESLNLMSDTINKQMLALKQAYAEVEMRVGERTAELTASNEALTAEAAERKMISEALLKREAELNESQRVAHIGSWDWDAGTDTIWWSDEYYRIYSIDPRLPPFNYMEHLKAYTPESIARLDAAVKKSMETGEPYTLDLELAEPNAATRWVVARGEAKRDADGRIVGLRGTAQNITERKQAEYEIRKLNEELEERVQKRTSDLEEKSEELQNSQFALINMVGDLNETNEKLSREMERRKEAQEELELLNDDLIKQKHMLESVNRELEAFSYSVSHDLRAPLRAIDGFSQAVLEDYGNKLDDVGGDYLRRIRVASQRMGQLIDDILGLSRVGRYEMKIEPVDLSSLALTVADELRRMHPEREVEIVVQEGVTAMGDSRLLRIVIENLFGNAWKFSSRNSRSRIEFGCLSDGGEAVCFVKDNGVGFDMAHSDKLFSPFQRLESAQEFPGTGIGLATVWRVIMRHKGRIWAKSEPGRGATFYFTV